MAEQSPNFNFPYLAPAQAQKHVTVNETVRMLDALTHLAVLSRNDVDPPSSPANGDRYLVGASATGAWAGRDGAIAAYQDGAWAFFTPQAGWRAYVVDENIAVLYTGAAWTIEPYGGVAAESANGAALTLNLAEVDHTLSAGATSDTGAIIPDRAVVFGVTARVLTSITGIASWDLGVAGATDRYGTGIGAAQGSTVNGVSGQPVAYYGATALRLTANGGAFSGGVVRLAVHYVLLTVPDA
ncbi:MAG: DUF2793 domain-containing protein [Pseudomonadota bacterium]